MKRVSQMRREIAAAIGGEGDPGEIGAAISRLLRDLASRRPRLIPVGDPLPLERLGLSPRAQRTLLASGYVTIGQVEHEDPAELRRIVNLGPKAVDEIVAAIRAWRSEHMDTSKDSRS